MAEEIIDIRDRIEKMRFQIETDSAKQITPSKQPKIHNNNSNSSISLSLQEKIIDTNENDNRSTDTSKNNTLKSESKSPNSKNEAFPSVSLSVKNPVSSKILIAMITFQVISNIGIMFLLYLGMK